MSRSWKTPLFVVAVISLAAGGLLLLRWDPPHVQIAPERILKLGDFYLTNTILSSYLTTFVLALTFWALTRRASLVPGRAQALAELVIEVFLGLCETVAGKQNGRRFLTLVMSIFLFVLFANWLGLFPGFSTIGVWEHPEVAAQAVIAPAAGEHTSPAATDEHAADKPILVPLLRGATTDLNTTLALALVSVIATQVYGIRTLGAGPYLSKFFNFREGPIGAFVGILELVGEVSRILSFSFRLFGNIFAGEVLLAVVGFLVPLVATLPFLGLEVFVGMIQAFIFAMLTLVFMTIATIGHGGHHEAAPESHQPQVAVR